MNTTELLHTTSQSEHRMLLPLLAFAAGDAFGVAYEYLPHRIPVDVSTLAVRGDWPPGGVSDDTHLSLLTIDAAHHGDPATAGDRFLHQLRVALPRLRGLGPTTKSALGLPPDPGEGYAVVGETVIGETNGGMMRTSLVGLGYNSARSNQRREMVAELTRATHRVRSAVECALLCSSLYSQALDDDAPIGRHLVREAGRIDIEQGSRLAGWLADIDGWRPPEQGIPLDPVETLAAVVWVAGRSTDPLTAYRRACELGGDTDTVAALAGGLVVARGSGSSLLDIPWIDEVSWSEIPEIATAAAQLAEMRAAA